MRHAHGAGAPNRARCVQPRANSGACIRTGARSLAHASGRARRERQRGGSGAPRAAARRRRRHGVREAAGAERGEGMAAEAAEAVAMAATAAAAAAAATCSLASPGCPLYGNSSEAPPPHRRSGGVMGPLPPAAFRLPHARSARGQGARAKRVARAAHRSLHRPLASH